MLPLIPLARYDYAPYGELSRSAGLPLTVGYTGHRWDQAVGQYFAPFRYYNPKTARWNMRDPLGMGAGLNMYAYVAGRPLRFIDPLGLCPYTDEERDNLLKEAHTWDGTHYKYGGNKKKNGDDHGGVDCSHFVCTAGGYPYTRASEWPNRKDFRKVTRSEAKKGDVIFWGGHIGFYDPDNYENSALSAIGDPSRPRRPGDVVKNHPIDYIGQNPVFYVYDPPGQPCP